MTLSYYCGTATTGQCTMYGTVLAQPWGAGSVSEVLTAGAGGTLLTAWLFHHGEQLLATQNLKVVEWTTAHT